MLANLLPRGSLSQKSILPDVLNYAYSNKVDTVAELHQIILERL